MRGAAPSWRRCARVKFSSLTQLNFLFILQCTDVVRRTNTSYQHSTPVFSAAVTERVLEDGRALDYEGKGPPTGQ